MRVDPRIANLAKRIDDEKPPPVLMRRWIADLLGEMLEEKGRYLEGVNEPYSAPIVPGGLRMYHLRLCGQERKAAVDVNIKAWSLVRKSENCEVCKEVERLTRPTPIA